MIYLLLGLAAMWFAEVSRIPQSTSEFLCKYKIIWKDVLGQRAPIRMLPFDCAKCLGFWVGLFYSYFDYEPVGLILLCAALTSLVSQTSCLIYNKLLPEWSQKK